MQLLTESGELEGVRCVDDVNEELEVKVAGPVAGVLHHAELEGSLDLIAVLLEHDSCNKQQPFTPNIYEFGPFLNMVSDFCQNGVDLLCAFL